MVILRGSIVLVKPGAVLWPIVVTVTQRRCVCRSRPYRHRATVRRENHMVIASP
jgi:hypothetical protein